MASKFSSALSLANLDDFIAPSLECIIPVQVKAPPAGSGDSKRGQIRIEDDGTYSELNETGTDPVKLQKVSVTLNDCLACSGCITSAESVLVSAQSQEEVLKVLAENAGKDAHSRRWTCISISPQSCAAIAAEKGLSYRDTMLKLCTYFKSLGVDWVVDVTTARDLSLVESCREFVRRKTTPDESSRSLPMLSSSCPGWVCYAEKTHGSFIIPYISSTKSPQQVMGSAIKGFVAKRHGLPPERVYHVTVMMCYDKKLEASREDFYSDLYRTRDVDCVITTGEVLQLLESVDLQHLATTSMDTVLTDCPSRGEPYTHRGGGSGGYLEHIFRYATQELYGVTAPDNLEYVTKRNQDFQEVSLMHDGKPVLQFALAYGFRNIQSIVRKLKTKKCAYDFVEVMACPGGCLNGGGQALPSDRVEAKERLTLIKDLYASPPSVDPFTNEITSRLYSEWVSQESDTALRHAQSQVNGQESEVTGQEYDVGGQVSEPMELDCNRSEKSDQPPLLHTQYHRVEATTNALTIKW